MIEVVKILMDFGMDFDYEHNGSQGQILRSLECGLQIWEQQGLITLEYLGDREEHMVSDENYKRIASLVNEIMIQETT